MTSKRKMHWPDEIAQRLIHHAARRAPATLSARLGEEWLADMAERRSGFSRLRFALGCCWATRVIAYELGAALPAAACAAGYGRIPGLGRTDSPWVSRRTMTFMLVVCLHAAVLCGLIVGVTSQFKKTIPGPFEVKSVDSAPRPMDPPTIVGPKIATATLFVPPLDDKDLRIEAEQKDRIVGMPVEPQGSGAGSTMVQHTVSRVQGGPGLGFPSTDDYYPSIAIFRGEKGVATVKACVDGRGRLTSEPIIIESAGFARLDESALKLAKAGSGHYRATTEDGQPVNSCYPFRIRFDLRN